MNMNMNRYLSEVVVSKINNKKLFQILNLKKIGLNNFDLVLPKIIKFKKFFKFRIHLNIECIIWICKFNFFDFVFDQKRKLHFNFVDSICAGGYLDVVEWLHKNRPELFKNLSEETMYFAVFNGHLDIIKWLHEKFHIGNDAVVMMPPARSGRLDIIKFFYENIPKLSENDKINIIKWATQNGHLNVVEWIYEKKPELTEDSIIDIIDWATKYKYFDIVIYYLKSKINKN